jgi:hypothetical protein
MEEKSTSVPTTLTEAVLSKDAVVSALEVGSVLFEDALPEVVARVPALSAVASALGGISGIREKLLLKKIVYFLSEQDEVSEADRWEFRRRIETNPEEREKIGEYLILLLDRLDNTEKARLVGKLFSAFLRRRLTKDVFQLSCAGVDRAHLADLLAIARNGEAPHGEIGSRLFAAGLTTLQVTSLNDMPQLGALARGFQTYPVNEIGKTLLDICFPHFGPERTASKRPKRPPA